MTKKKPSTKRPKKPATMKGRVGGKPTPAPVRPDPRVTAALISED